MPPTVSDAGQQGRNQGKHAKGRALRWGIVAAGTIAGACSGGSTCAAIVTTDPNANACTTAADGSTATTCADAGDAGDAAGE